MTVIGNKILPPFIPPVREPGSWVGLMGSDDEQVQPSSVVLMYDKAGQGGQGKRGAELVIATVFNAMTGFPLLGS